MSPNGSVTVEPSSLLANQTDTVIFTCSSEGGPGNTYEWFHNGQIISGEISPTLTLANISVSDEGNYTCTVSNAVGSGSDVSTLTINGMYNTGII